MDADRTDEEPIEEPRPRPRATPGPRSAERRTTELRSGDRRAAGDAPPELTTGGPSTGDPSTGDPSTGDPGTGDPGTGDPRTGDPRTGDPRTGDPRTGDRRTGDLRAGDYRAGEARPVPTNIYRARRPAVAILLIIPAVAVGLLLIRALAISAFGDPFQIGGVIASACALASLPLLVAGLYGLVTGAAHGAEHYGFKVWARPPLAYLLVGLGFVLAAGLAIR